jgi:hypothetical protein
MPSIATQTDMRRTGGRQGRKRGGFKYKTGSKSAGSARKGNQNIIMLKTLSNKSENLSISFRETFDFTNMGGRAGSTPMLLRVSMNNPFRGGVNPAPGSGNGIASVIGSLKGGSIDPEFTRHSYENKLNLEERLNDYAFQYRSCVVTASEVIFNVRPKLNQTWSNSGNKSLIPYFLNKDDATHGPYLETSVKANASGDLYVWSVRQQNQNQLHDSTNGTPPLETLKQGIPGVRMSKLNVTPVSTKGVRMKLKYTPRSQFDIKDWRDNKQLLKCLNGTKANPVIVNPDLKDSFAYLGIAGRINGQDPDPDVSGLGIGLANCIVEVAVRYNLHFSERYNIDGNNEPVPHEEL